MVLPVPEEGWPAVRNRTVLTGHGETSAKASLRFASMISCLPPGLHPAGSRYRWEAGLGPGEIEPAEIPRLLLDRAEYEPQEMASIVNAAWRGDLARVAEALADGSAPDAPAADGYTALLRAVWAGHTACARLLLEAGADPAQRDRWGGQRCCSHRKWPTPVSWPRSSRLGPQSRPAIAMAARRFMAPAGAGIQRRLRCSQPPAQTAEPGIVIGASRATRLARGYDGLVELDLARARPCPRHPDSRVRQAWGR